jgi:hypothetical protein
VPADCAGNAGGTDCCANATIINGPDGGTTLLAGCGIQSVNTYCGSCTTQVNFAGNCTALATDGGGTTPLLHTCATSADCAADTANTKCCQVQGYNVCINSSLPTFDKALVCN